VATPELEGLALKIARDSTYDRDEDSRNTRYQLFRLFGPNYHSPELFNEFYQSRKRALTERRAGPHAAANGTSAQLLGSLSPNIPDTEEPIAALLPLLDDACDGQDLVNILAKRHYAPAFERLRDLYFRSTVTRRQCDESITDLFQSLQTRTAMEAIVQRARWLSDQPAGSYRDQDLLHTISALSPVADEDQGDVKGLQRDVLEKPMTPELHAKLDAMFEVQIEAARRVHDTSPDNLFYWLDRTFRSRPDIVISLIENGADPNAVNKSGITLLHQALAEPATNCTTRNTSDQARYNELVAVLVTHGGNVVAADRNALTPLYYAAQAGNVPAMDLLVKHGAQLDVVTVKRGFNMPVGQPSSADKWTLIHEATACHKAEVITYLLDHHADINARLTNGLTPLMLAVATEDRTLARLLVDRGADVTLGMDGKVTPILVAHEKGLTDVEELLRSKGAVLNPITVAERAILRKYFEWMFSGGMN
jgi:ankyrin repeat protein